MLFKPECREAWVADEDCVPPANWLEDLGFGDMEYFEVRVGGMDGWVSSDSK
jgi:hypothetical protein